VSTRIKFCGCTSLADVELAAGAGADAFGIIFAESPRRVSWEVAERIAAADRWGLTPVGVFVDPPAADVMRFRRLFPDGIAQFSGDEEPAAVAGSGGASIKVLHVDPDDEPDGLLARRADAYAPALVMLETKSAGARGGTGKTFAWSRVAAFARWHPILIAGGLTPENVGECVRAVRPFGVDVRSGIETGGRKDPDKMRRFVMAVRENDAT
jgi:phosphoribosylanthranilate isomerase